MNELSTRIQRNLAERRQQRLLRQRVISNNPTWINFCSNDYLSLANDKRVKKAYQAGYEQYPAGSGASAVVSGYHSIHCQLEQKFAQILAVDEAMLFNSGYAANVAVIALLAGLDVSLIIDKAMHASCYDGIKAAGLHYQRYIHNDLADLAQVIQKAPQSSVLMTEAIFSMSGQCAILNEIVDLINPCIVDEAHAFGVLGEHGLGAVHQAGLSQEQVPLRIITFGKSMAGQGAIVAGKQEWIELLLQYARPLLYSTAMSPAAAYGLMQTLDLVYEADERRTKLLELIRYFRQWTLSSPLDFTDSHTPIQQLQLGCPHRAIRYSEQLQQAGIFCLAMRKPTVSLQHTGLRVVLNYCHSTDDIDQLFQQLHAYYDSEYSN